MTATEVSREAPTFPAAELDRRFYAFTLDRLIAWTLDAVAAVAAYRLLIAEGSVLAGIAVIVGTVVVVGVTFSVLQGIKGFTPGKAALGLRVVHLGSGTPIGPAPALLRSLLLGLAALPTFGLGVATLAWTAVMDHGRQRRGWHDHVSGSIVVDVRPAPVEEAVVDHGPRHIVNLTAMRLVPAAPQAPPARPRTPRPAGVPAAAAPTTPATATPTPSATADPTTVTPTAVTPTTAAPAGSHRATGLRAPLGPPLDPPSRTGGTLAPEGAAAPTVRWRVAFDTGESFPVEGLVLVGRRPEPRAGEPVRHLVPLPSQDMSLSKTHAQLQVAPDGVLVVMDRGSTNGSVVLRGGVSRELPAGQPTTLLAGDLVRFGDRTMTVSREA